MRMSARKMIRTLIRILIGILTVTHCTTTIAITTMIEDRRTMDMKNKSSNSHSL